MYDLGSPVAIFMRLPSSLKNEAEVGPTVPLVSTATGWNCYMGSRWAYFLVFSTSA